jgi:hypothetical protein
VRLRTIPNNQSLYIVGKGEVDSISLGNQALFKLSRDFKSNGRILFNWVDNWTPLIPFHSQMLAQDQLVDEQCYRDNSNSPNPEGRMGVGDDENSG